MLRALLLVALFANAGAFAPASSALPSLRRAGAQCSQIVMNSEKDVEAESLSKRRMVVGGLLALLAPIAGLPSGADAARSGGRVGGGSFRKAPAPAPAARPSTTVVRPSVTVIQSAPTMPFGYGGMYGGYGGGMFGGGLTTGQFLGLSAIELAESIARENRRRAALEEQMRIQRELGKDQAQIDALQKQLAETNAKMSAMQEAQKQQQK